jgi:hypothetical protein
MRHAVVLIVLITLGLTAAARAADLQTLTADIDGTSFESDDDGISFIPVMGSFSLAASTKGASAWPPPTTRIDRLSIVCRPYDEAATKTFSSTDFQNSGCDVTFAVGTKSMGGDPDASYRLDKDSPNNQLAITHAAGKTISGTFQFDLTDDAGKSVHVRNGRFAAEDRQY